MSFCYNCFHKLDTLREPCPHCGAPALKKTRNNDFSSTYDNIRNMESPLNNTQKDYVGEIEIERLLKRGIECFNHGKAYQATKDRSRARKDFQRALNYFETILKMDSTNNEARDFRAKCLQKMA